MVGKTQSPSRQGPCSGLKLSHWSLFGLWDLEFGFSDESADGLVRSDMRERSGCGTSASFVPEIGPGSFFWSETPAWRDASGPRLAASLVGSLLDDGLFCGMACDADGSLRLTRDSKLGEGSDDAGPHADNPMRSTRLSEHPKHEDGQSRNTRMSLDSFH